MPEVKLEPSWKSRLEGEFAADYMQRLGKFLRSEKAAGKKIYPPGREIFHAFSLTPFNLVKVIILGQDPYHGPGQAHGLSFSVRPGISKPPSLNNIFKELQSDLGIQPPPHGNLENWAKAGVLLLNSCLTVADGQASAHAGEGWERFTDAVIDQLNQHKRHLVFILWGRKAQEKGNKIDRHRHFVMASAHPSPLAAHNGFFGSAPFSKANAYLCQHGITPINWDITADH